MADSSSSSSGDDSPPRLPDDLDEGFSESQPFSGETANSTTATGVAAASAKRKPQAAAATASMADVAADLGNATDKLNELTDALVESAGGTAAVKRLHDQAEEDAKDGGEYETTDTKAADTREVRMLPDRGGEDDPASPV